MTQGHLAKYVGCSIETVRKIEKGRISLSEELAYKISVATGVAQKWLLANDLNAPPINGFGKPYTRRDFDSTRSEDWIIEPSLTVHVALGYHARIRALESAAFASGFKTYRIAMFRLNAALRELENEYGSDKAIYDVDTPNLRQAFELTKKAVLEVEPLFAPPQFGPPPPPTDRIIELRDGSVMKVTVDRTTGKPLKNTIVRRPRS